jgi:hypothetical protein
MLTGSKRPTDATAVTGAPVDIRGAERTRGVPGMTFQVSGGRATRSAGG